MQWGRPSQRSSCPILHRPHAAGKRSQTGGRALPAGPPAVTSSSKRQLTAPSPALIFNLGLLVAGPSQHMPPPQLNWLLRLDGDADERAPPSRRGGGCWHDASAGCCPHAGQLCSKRHRRGSLPSLPHWPSECRGPHHAGGLQRLLEAENCTERKCCRRDGRFGSAIMVAAADGAAAEGLLTGRPWARLPCFLCGCRRHPGWS